jgi:Zn-dependent protease
MTSAADSPDERGHGVRIGRVVGVPVYLAPSWFLIALVIIVIVAQPVLDTNPVYGLTRGVLQALLLLVSVLVHEAAHAIAAKSLGMPVVRIVANLWGGHTSFEALRPSPGRLAVVALAGPFANAVLAGLAVVGLLVTHGGLTANLLEGLLIINGALALFNVIPALPLDGGQALESVVWAATGDRTKGSVVAGWAGRVLAVAAVVWFIVLPLTRGERPGFSAIWAVVIASVIWTGATAAINRGKAVASLGRLTVGQVAVPADAVPPTTTIQAALDHHRAIVTTDARGIPNLLFGGLSDELPPEAIRSAPLSSAVLRLPDGNVVEATPEQPVDAVVAAMQQSGVGFVVLTAGGRVWGLATVDAVNKAATARN